MTGAACLWVVVSVFFIIPLVVDLIYIGIKAIDESLSWKGALAGFGICLIASVGSMVAAHNCQKCYDVNFAVAMKNINYTRTTEVNTQIEMNYQDVTENSDNK
jgi:uncharacterized membrane protein YagU involved in acid resistance